MPSPTGRRHRLPPSASTSAAAASTGLLDLDGVIIDGSFSRELSQSVLQNVEASQALYNCSWSSTARSAARTTQHPQSGACSNQLRDDASTQTQRAVCGPSAVNGVTWAFVGGHALLAGVLWGATFVCADAPPK